MLLLLRLVVRLLVLVRVLLVPVLLLLLGLLEGRLMVLLLLLLLRLQCLPHADPPPLLLGLVGIIAPPKRLLRMLLRRIKFPVESAFPLLLRLLLEVLRGVEASPLRLAGKGLVLLLRLRGLLVLQLRLGGLLVLRRLML